jgi:hypothetical protein
MEHKRAREAVDLAAGGCGEEGSPQADAKRLRPQDLLDMLEDDTDTAAVGDLASVMRRASEDELGLPPSGAASSSEEEAGRAGAPKLALDGQIWAFEGGGVLSFLAGGGMDWAAVSGSPSWGAAAMDPGSTMLSFAGLSSSATDAEVRLQDFVAGRVEVEATAASITHGRGRR